MSHALILIFTWFSLSTAWADFTADVYEIGSNKGKKIYTYVNHLIEKDGVTDSETIYKDPTGQIVAEERGTMRDGNLVKYEIQHRQLNQTGIVEIKDGRVIFNKVTDGKTKTSDEKIKGTLLISTNFHHYVRDHWQELLQGKEFDFRFASWERMETVGFEIKKIGEEKIKGEDAVVIRMKPSSFFIAALVKPIVFKFSAKDASRMLAMTGRVVPKEKSGEKWKDLDGDVEYTY